VDYLLQVGKNFFVGRGKAIRIITDENDFSTGEVNFLPTILSMQITNGNNFHTD
jgi:hypothetical protein